MTLSDGTMEGVNGYFVRTDGNGNPLSIDGSTTVGDCNSDFTSLDESCRIYADGIDTGLWGKV